MRSRIPRRVLVVGYRGAALGGDILYEGPAKRDVEDLDSAADRQNGFPPLPCLLDERGFRRIARRVDGAYFFVALFAVARGIDVFTSGQYETRDRFENGRGSAGARQRGDDEWYEACTFESTHVSGGKSDTAGIAIGANASGNSNCAGWSRLARGRHE